MPTVAEIISIAKVCEYLSLVANNRVNQYNGTVDLKLPRKLYAIRKNVEWLYGLDSSDDTLVGTASYLYALCAPYSGQAAIIAGSGGSGIIINPTTGQAANLIGVYIQFRVGDVGALMTAGQTVLILNYDNPISGTISVVLDGVELPQNDITQISYIVVMTTTSIAITFNNPVSNLQQYQIRFLRTITV